MLQGGVLQEHPIPVTEGISAVCLGSLSITKNNTGCRAPVHTLPHLRHPGQSLKALLKCLEGKMEPNMLSSSHSELSA